MSEKRQPWMKWYPSDWRSEPRLRLVSRAARSLWMDMLGLMHEAEPYGHLVVGGRSLDAKGLATLLGDRPSETKKLLKELEFQEIFSTTQDGTIYSRRMVRDKERAAVNKENGGKGGNPTLKPKDNSGVNHQDKAQKPEARDQKPEVVAAAHNAQENSDQLNRLGRIMGFDASNFTAYAANLRTLIDLKIQGCDFERHILPAAEGAARGGRTVGSLAYIRPKALELRDAARIVDSIPPPFETTDERGWRDRLRVFRDKAMWSPKWGAKPGEPGCKCPAEILAEGQGSAAA